MSDDVTDEGERVVASVKDGTFYGHLSVYRFAAPMVRGLRVVDAGCGTGYGSAYLAENGAAQVVGFDVSPKAVAYCQRTVRSSNVAFAVADLSSAVPLAERSVDAIFSSQAMEHLADIETFLAECRRVLRPRGSMIIAVPAIVSPRQLEENIWNKYHVTNLTPLGWYTKLRRNFGRVTAYRHWPNAPFDNWDRLRAELAAPPAETTIREGDFSFIKTPIAKLNREESNLNTVLIARRPRRQAKPPRVEEFIPHAWQEGALHAKIRHEETEMLRWKLWQSQQRR